MNRPAALALALALALPACDRPAPAPGTDPATVPARTASDPAMAETRECVDRAEGFAVEFPAGWHTDDEAVMGPCALFHPEPFRVPRDSEVPLELAVMIGFQRVPFATLAGEMMGRRVISREETTVDGRAAVRILAETTGEGLHDAGIRYYEYVVDLGEETMTAATYDFDAGGFPFERRRRILDDMMATFDFREPA
jgi:hypothetical protein